jgi:hypothetical protein
VRLSPSGEVYVKARGNRLITAGSVVMLATMVTSLVGAPAQAAPDNDGVTVHGNGVTVDSEGRVRYNVDLMELPGATISAEKGVRTAKGSCTFDTEQRGKAGKAKVLIVTEISYDPTTCSREVARAEYDRNALPASVRAKIDARPDTSDENSETDKTAKAQTAVATAAAGGPWSGSLKVNVEDPPQIDVTTTKSYLTWSTDDVYLYSDHKAEWGWFTGSGWGRESYNWTHDNNGWYAYTDTTAHYRNGVFCLTIDTHTYHNQTYFEGWYDGYWYWSYQVDKSGGCTDLLHYEYIAETP